MAKLTVTVQNTSGVTLEKANVSYEYGSVTGVVATDTAGVATVSGLPAGEYKVTGSISGYTAQSVDITIGTEDISVTIELPVSPTAAVESAAQKVLNSTVVTDWKTVKAAAEAAVTQLNTSVSTSDLTDSVVLATVYSQVTAVIQQAVSQVDAYKSQLMISRHTKGFWECVLIDAKLVGITVFQRWLSAEITGLQKKLEDKLGNI